MGGEKTTFTWKQVSEHCTADDCWVIANAKVYDVTKWLPKHPAGSDVIVMSSGRDCTQVFESYHPVSAEAVLEKYYIGDLVDKELVTFPASTESNFYPTLRDAVNKYFKDKNIDPKFAPMMFVRYFLIYLTFALSYYASFVLFRDSYWLCLAFQIPLGFSAALVGLMPLHDASHMTIGHNPLVWKFFGATHDLINGASFFVWIHQHVLGHHPYTNVGGMDPDIDTVEHDIRRIKPYQRWLPFYVAQHFYVPFVYGLLAWKTRIQDLTITFKEKRNGVVRINPVSTYHKVMLVFGKIFWVYYRVLIPYFMFDIPMSTVIACFTVADFTTSYGEGQRRKGRQGREKTNVERIVG
eukprot:TRINITY_DN562_c0_g1_i1.p1 TRINITY_DN562_c0_g1~~TRINITY_DN562_c0_g1_i1.p1  ORF type:complete len:352 (-),score=93.24 TRINITY_DN562_c0_g1_i1:562-1617(-)